MVRIMTIGHWQEWLIAAVIIGMLTVGATVVITAARSYAEAPCDAPDPGWGPPDLSLCPEDMALWDCIKTASYRSDI
jgi:hypothetical protein